METLHIFTPKHSRTWGSVHVRASGHSRENSLHLDRIIMPLQGDWISDEHEQGGGGQA